ncbi:MULTISPECIES: MCE family protein [unclassified Nocardia]|uniref:MCE family protein n=1 Tax=unclassified Nocardia TaxID=2637762 RepID=UPI0024A9C1AF|nr:MULTISPECIES: MCE family protein [unclassified Nocardia]
MTATARNSTPRSLIPRSVGIGRRLRDRPLESLRQTWLGALALAALVLAVAATTLVTTLHIGQATYTAEFGQAAGIRPGDQVTVAGVPVGTVGGTELAGDRVLVRMKIDGDVALGAQTRAEIVLTTVLGARSIALMPAGDGSLPDGRIPLTHTTVPYDLQKLLQDSTATFEQVDADRFARSMGLLAAQLRDTPAILPEALANVENLSRMIAERRDQIGALLRNTAQLATILGDQSGDMAALIGQGDVMVREILARRAGVVRLLDAATQLVTIAHTVAVGNREHIDSLLVDIRTLTGMIGDHDELLRNMFQAMPIAVRNITNATGTGPFLDFLLPGGLMVDSWMCAISANAEQHHWPEHFRYFEDCR